jgi:hypothetical protein
MIRNAPGRRDLHLILDGKLKDRTLTFTSSRQWEDATVYFSGTVGKGKHTAYLRGPNANTWGCQDQWGDLDIVTIPIIKGMAAYQTPDTRRGCPPGAGANKALISKTFTVSAPSILMVQGHLIRNAPGRRDLFLYVDKGLKDRTLTYTSSRQWEDASVFYSGTVGAGTHTAYLASPNANTWGCQDQWGDLDIVVMPAYIAAGGPCQNCVTTHQTPDSRRGCPPKAGSNARLIQKSFYANTPSVIIAQGHLIRNAAGRRDLFLYVDGGLKDRTLTYTRNRQWEDASVFWVGGVDAGIHTAWLAGPNANTWGCQDQWGDLDIAVIPAAPGINAYQTPDGRSGCPPKAGANSALIRKDFSLDTPSVIMATGHLIRNAPGRRDLHMIVDGKLKDNTLTFSSSRQWEDATVFWSGALGKGKHSVYLRSPQANVWGCGPGRSGGGRI